MLNPQYLGVHTINGLVARFRTEDHNKVIRDAHRILPGYTAAMERNVRLLRIEDAHHQSVIDAVHAARPGLILPSGPISFLRSSFKSKPRPKGKFKAKPPLKKAA